MKFLRKLDNNRAAAGLERVILRKLPGAMLGSILLPLGIAIGNRLYLGSGAAAAKTIKTVDIFLFAVALTAVTAVFTVAIGCILVAIMKGPGYVADAYPLEDSERPASGPAGERAERKDGASGAMKD